MTATPTFAIGDTAPTRSYGPLTRTDIVRYAGASGDFNPIHHDEAFAQSAGYPTVFSIGMLQAGILGGFTAQWVGAANLRRFGVRFRDQVWPGDTLTCTGTVVKVDVGEGGTEIALELECRRQDGAVAVSGTATALVPSS